MNYVVYNRHSGKILRQISPPQSDLNKNLKCFESVILLSDILFDDDNYVDHATGEIIPKADYELSALPLPCIITIEGTTYEVTSQPTFQFDAPGVYIVQVDAGPKYLKKEFTIDYQP